MAYISIPSLNYKDLKFDIQVESDDNSLQTDSNSEIFISQSLNHYLSSIKKQIDIYYINWDYYKKITNPYEYIHTHVPEKNAAICKYKPLSRSFFKMIEIIHIFNFLSEKASITSFHLAEGPGGFIEAFNYIRKNKNDKYYGMTLMSDDNNIPSWKKSYTFINNNKNVVIEYGKSKTGDLFLKENLQYCNENYKNSIDYITADGGFDFSIDFNKQEDMSLKLILAQVFFALIMQKKGGCFVLKIFDIFKLKTVDILFLLANLYENIYIYKPHTSRIANSEKYIVCKHYKGDILNINKQIIEKFDKILSNIDSIRTLFNVEFPKFFINKLEEINAIYGQQQIENINYTLNIIKEYISIKNGDDINYNISYDIDNNSDNSDNNSDNTGNNNDNSIDEISNKSKNIDINNSNSYKIDENYIIKSPQSIESEESDIFLNQSSINNRNKKIKYYIDVSDNINNFNIKNLNIEDNKYLKMNINKLNNKLSILKNINIQKSINWCNKYDLPLHKQFIS